MVRIPSLALSSTVVPRDHRDHHGAPALPHPRRHAPAVPEPHRHLRANPRRTPPHGPPGPRLPYLRYRHPRLHRPTRNRSRTGGPEMTKRRSRGDGGLHWSESRQRWIGEITIGYDGRGKRITRKA